MTDLNNSLKQIVDLGHLNRRVSGNFVFGPEGVDRLGDDAVLVFHVIVKERLDGMILAAHWAPEVETAYIPYMFRHVSPIGELFAADAIYRLAGDFGSFDAFLQRFLRCCFRNLRLRLGNVFGGFFRRRRFPVHFDLMAAQR